MISIGSLQPSTLRSTYTLAGTLAKVLSHAALASHGSTCQAGIAILLCNFGVSAILWARGNKCEWQEVVPQNQTLTLAHALASSTGPPAGMTIPLVRLPSFNLQQYLLGLLRSVWALAIACARSSHRVEESPLSYS